MSVDSNQSHPSIDLSHQSKTSIDSSQVHISRVSTTQSKSPEDPHAHVERPPHMQSSNPHKHVEKPSHGEEPHTHVEKPSHGVKPHTRGEKPKNTCIHVEKPHSKPSEGSQKPSGSKKRNTNSWRTLVINCNSVSGKKSELAERVEYTDPDVILLTETKLDSSIGTAEFIPEGYQGNIRRDRNRSGGGVMIMTKSCYSVDAIDLDDVQAETLWASVTVAGNKKLVVGVFYRQPGNSTDQIDQLVKALQQVTGKFKNNNNITFMLGGDFNAGDIDWDTGTVLDNSSNKKVNEQVVSLQETYGLVQMQREPTRIYNILDLFFTNKPSLVNTVRSIPGISDHEIIMADCDIKSQINKKPPRKIHHWSKADWDLIKTKASDFCNSFIADLNNNSVDTNYKKFREFIENVIEENVPSKLLKSTRRNLPWITQRIRRMCKKKQRIYNKAKRSRKAKDWSSYNSFKKDTSKAIRRSHMQYVNNILQQGLESSDTKPFWR